jgi:hypothetical protein
LYELHAPQDTTSFSVSPIHLPLVVICSGMTGKQEAATEEIGDGNGPERVCHQKIDTSTTKNEPGPRRVVTECSHKCGTIDSGGDDQIDEHPGKTAPDIAYGISDTGMHT